MWNYIDKLVSAVRNDVNAGLRGYHQNPSMSLEQLADDIVSERLQIIKEYQLKGILPIKDLAISINCIPIDCKDIEKCRKCSNLEGTATKHFEIPQIVNDFGTDAIIYIGSVDRQNPFTYYTSLTEYNTYNKYRRRGKNKPYVYIDTTPNENGMYDCFVFNAPLISSISVTAVFKDPRQLCNYDCPVEDTHNLSWIDNEIKSRVTKKKLYYYRQAAPSLLPNDQQYTAG